MQMENIQEIRLAKNTYKNMQLHDIQDTSYNGTRTWNVIWIQEIHAM